RRRRLARLRAPRRALPGAAPTARLGGGAELRGDRGRARHADRCDRPHQDALPGEAPQFHHRRPSIPRRCGMSNRPYERDELLDELRSVLARADAAPAEVTEFAKAALGWRRLD